MNTAIPVVILNILGILRVYQLELRCCGVPARTPEVGQVGTGLKQCDHYLKQCERRRVLLSKPHCVYPDRIAWSCIDSSYTSYANRKERGGKAVVAEVLQ